MARLDDENEMLNNSYEVNSSDDEEIDEDEAFNSDDELMYGEFFLSTTKKKKKSTNDGDKKMKAKRSLNSSSDESDSDDESDGDSESDENDWAGGSRSDDDDSNEGEEDDGGAYMLDLLNNLDKQVPTKSNDKKKQHENKGEGGKISYTNQSSEAAVHLKESEYQSGVLSAMNNEEDGGDGNGKLTLDSLMGGISDTAGFATVQKSMRALSSGLVVDKDGEGGQQQQKKKLTTTAAPVSRVISDRASRKVHYEATTEDVTQWKDAIHEQRDAETLDFRTNKGGATTNRITRDVLVDKFEATTDFEKEIQVALEKAGMDNEGSMLKKEKSRLTGEQQDDDIDDLGSNHITMEEYKKRHGELAKLRALMFYEEQKRHRINKIKSKKYRKIRKRQKDKLTSAEMDVAAMLQDDPTTTDRERIEREEMDRMKERMTLAHKNTSKWARHMLRRGAKMDIEERRALSLQIAKGEELRRKVMGEEEDNDGASDDEEETEEDLLKKARDILMENDDDETNAGGSKKKKGLFQLAFMERGMQAQRTRAKEEARKLLEELEANEMAGMSSSDSSDSDEDGEDGEELKSNKKKKQRVASEAETNKVLSEGKLVASSLKFGKGDGFAIKVDGDIKLGGDELKGKEVGKKQGKKQKKKPKPQALVKPTLPQAEEEEENPWIVSKSTNKSTKPLSRTVNIDKAASMLVDNVQEDKTSKRKRDDDVDDNKTILLESTTVTADSPPASSEKEVGVAELSQAELVRRAFAKPADLEAEEEFLKEKERMKERDDPTRKKVEEKVVSGWGSWAGAGAPPPRKRKLPPKLRAPASKKVDKAVKRKDDGMSTVIINQKRLKKTAAFQLSEIPYPYRSREEYEKAIAGNIGQEWNTMKGSKEMSRPAILVRAGKIINPLTKKAKSKQKRAPAKF